MGETFERSEHGGFLCSVRIFFYRLITALCFIVFSNRISSLFANLTILSLIYDIKGIRLDDKLYNNKNISHLLGAYINEKVLVFPKATVWVFWSDKTLNKQINLDGYKVTIREAIQNKDIFDRYKRRIIDCLVRDLPGIVKFKLGLHDRTMAILFRNNIVHTLNSI